MTNIARDVDPTVTLVHRHGVERRGGRQHLRGVQDRSGAPIQHAQGPAIDHKRVSGPLIDRHLEGVIADADRAQGRDQAPVWPTGGAAGGEHAHDARGEVDVIARRRPAIRDEDARRAGIDSDTRGIGSHAHGAKNSALYRVEHADGSGDEPGPTRRIRRVGIGGTVEVEHEGEARALVYHRAHRRVADGNDPRGRRHTGGGAHISGMTMRCNCREQDSRNTT